MDEKKIFGIIFR